MAHHKLKPGYFVLEWLNAYGSTIYLFYIFFYLRENYGFGNLENLFFSAAMGFIYIFTSWFSGRVAQRRGYYFALRLGFTAMALILVIGSQVASAVLELVVLLAYTTGLSFTWPSLEALVSDHEPRARIPRMVGLYNVIWASGAAVSYFTGGALMEHLGSASVFWVPAGIHAVQLIVLGLISRRAAAMGYAGSASHGHTDSPDAAAHHITPAVGKAFLRMAWLANPFAYVAMNTLLPLLPDVAARLQLSTTLAGFVGSVWMFARLGSFVALWKWPAWHYRFNWLAASYFAMLATFVLILVVSNLWVVLVMEVVFGFAVGLIYYSSLFYSMDVGDTKGEHGGLHEAMIGLGIFLGPAVGAASLRFVPGTQHAGVWAVAVLLTLGMGALWAIKPAARS